MNYPLAFSKSNGTEGKKIYWLVRLTKPTDNEAMLLFFAPYFSYVCGHWTDEDDFEVFVQMTCREKIDWWYQVYPKAIVVGLSSQRHLLNKHYRKIKEDEHVERGVKPSQTNRNSYKFGRQRG